MNQTRFQERIREIHSLFNLPLPELTEQIEDYAPAEAQEQQMQDSSEEEFFDSNYLLPLPFSKISPPITGAKSEKQQESKHFKVKPITKVREFEVENEIKSIGCFSLDFELEANEPNIYGSEHYQSLLRISFQSLRLLNRKKQLQEVLDYVNHIREIRSAPGLNYFKKYSAVEVQANDWQLGNLNALFNFELVQASQLSFQTYVLFVGEDGGLSDYVFYHFKSQVFSFKEQEVLAKAMIMGAVSDYETLRSQEERLFCTLPISQKISSNPKSITLEELRQLVEWQAKQIQGNKFSFAMCVSQLKYFQIGENEMHYVPYLLVHSILALFTLQQEGTLVLKLYEMDTHLTNQILYILSLHFRHFTVTTLAAQTLDSPQRYAVFRYLKQENSELIGLLVFFFQQYKTRNVHCFYDPSLVSKSYLDAVNYLNNEINEK